MEDRDNPIFSMKVRRCQRCGRLLTSKESVKVGYSYSCLQKLRREELMKAPLDGQINLFDLLESEDNKNG